MSEREQTLMKACLVLLGIVAIFLLLRRVYGPGVNSPGNVSYNIEGSSVGGDTTIGGTNIGGSTFSPPGITNNFNEGSYTGDQYAAPNVSSFQNYFNSENNIGVQTFGLNEMSSKYIPMFGLVGMTAVGNVVVNQQMAQQPAASNMIQAAPQQVYEAATRPYQGYMGNAPALKRYGGMNSIGAEMQLRKHARNGTLQQFLNS